jgi:dTDP-4-amino-4,6-dideoxygalactose transaminase
VLCDSAQAFGATLDGKHTVAFGHAAGTSFYPAKPLGCYGDGGCCFTNDDGLAATLRSLRVHGEGSDKYENVRIGLNSRLDTIQAAILIEKLTIFSDEIESRNRVAQRYARGFARSNRIGVPAVIEGGRSTWAQYTLVLENRQKIQAGLKEQGIPTVVYYPLPLHRQRAYSAYPVAPGGLPVSESLSNSVLSLPMHPYLADADVDRIIDALLSAVGETR